MADLIQLRRDSAATWASVNPILADGELGYERDTNRLKVGNGVQAWNSLSYVTDSFFVHEQMIAGAEWTINHNLGKYPSITVVDSAGDECEGDVKHMTVNQVVITFSAAFAGRAFCN